MPPALFTVGTDDPLLDDTLFMSTKWMVTGADTIVKIYEGAEHGFTAFTVEGDENAHKAMEEIKEWLKARLGK